MARDATTRTRGRPSGKVAAVAIAIVAVGGAVAAFLVLETSATSTPAHHFAAANHPDAPTATASTPPTTTTTTTRPPGPGFDAGRVTAVGDSVMLDYQDPLQTSIPGINVNAAVSRQWSDGESILQTLKADGQLGADVIVGLGTNGPITTSDFDDMMAILGGASRVVFINVHVDRPWQDLNNAVLAFGAARYPTSSSRTGPPWRPRTRSGSAPTEPIWRSTGPEQTRSRRWSHRLWPRGEGTPKSWRGGRGWSPRRPAVGTGAVARSVRAQPSRSSDRSARGIVGLRRSGCCCARGAHRVRERDRRHRKRSTRKVRYWRNRSFRVEACLKPRPRPIGRHAKEHQMARVLMVVQHPVKDFDAWRVEYDKAQPIRDRHGVTDATIFRNADDPNEITGLHWFASVDEAHAFADDPELKAAMARAGVSGPPRIEISIEV